MALRNIFHGFLDTVPQCKPRHSRNRKTLDRESAQIPTEFFIVPVKVFHGHPFEHGGFFELAIGLDLDAEHEQDGGGQDEKNHVPHVFLLLLQLFLICRDFAAMYYLHVVEATK